MATRRRAAADAEAVRAPKEGLELPAGASQLQTAGSVVSIVARFGLPSELAPAGAPRERRQQQQQPAADAAAADADAAPAVGFFFDTRAAAHAAVRGLGREQEALLLQSREGQRDEAPAAASGRPGSFLRSASAYFGHEVPVVAHERGPPPAPSASSSSSRAARQLLGRSDAVAVVGDDDDDEEGEALLKRSGSKKRQQQQQQQQRPSPPAAAAAAAAAAGAQSEHLPFRKNLSAADAPSYTTFPNITSGYRSGGTYTRCLLSLFELHTETLNAWTTIVGNAISVAMLVATLRRERVTCAADAAPFLLMTFSGLLHAPFSTGFHLFRCMNPSVYNLWRRLDHVFIYVMCWPAVAALSWFVLPPPLTLAAFCAAGVLARRAAKGIWGLKPHVQRDRREIVRAAGEVGALVLLQFAPMVLQSAREVLKGTARQWPSAQGAGGLVVAGMVGVPASLLFAANVFAAGVPERWAPGKFNLCGSSHQLMHVGVIGAVVSMYAFLTALLRHRVAMAEALGAAALPPPLSRAGGGFGALAAGLLGEAAEAVGFAGVVGSGGAGLSGW
jgi:adiponectin receptor